MNNLATYFSKHSTASPSDAYSLSWATGITLVLLFLRNLHGSACYDEFLARNPNYIPSFERRASESFWLSLLSICGLFLGPALATDTLQHHMDQNTSVFGFGAVLFSSIIAYTLFDVLLWFDAPGDPAGQQMRGIATRSLEKRIRLGYCYLFSCFRSMHCSCAHRDGH